MAQKIEVKVKETLTDLEKEELRLFHSYNRHATPSVKLTILNQLQYVIVRIDALKKLNN